MKAVHSKLLAIDAAPSYPDLGDLGYTTALKACRETAFGRGAGKQSDQSVFNTKNIKEHAIDRIKSQEQSRLSGRLSRVRVNVS